MMSANRWCFVAGSSRIVNLVVAVLMVLGGISQFFPIGLYVDTPPPFSRGGVSLDADDG